MVYLRSERLNNNHRPRPIWLINREAAGASAGMGGWRTRARERPPPCVWYPRCGPARDTRHKPSTIPTSTILKATAPAGPHRETDGRARARRRAHARQPQDSSRLKTQ
eukprot:scaffold6145_cov102-Isochrysis_galbana.AAC.2